MKGAPRSEQFDDIYFSADDGLAETQHVFIEGNNLPQAWEGKECFTICETGFGTGLNFFAAWDLFERTAAPDQELDFVSFEKFPLSPCEILEALKPWQDQFGDKIKQLCDHYPIRVGGFHRIKISEQVTLTLIFDDVNNAIPQLQSSVDCWFLDGFTPAKNPDMWSNILFENMARLSHQETTMATFTAAGFVRQGLSDVGFSIEKKRGFGRKRDMITGGFSTGAPRKERSTQKGKTVAIIGGGLAGMACAYILKKYGLVPIVYEAQSEEESQLSTNEYGFYNSRFSALWEAPAQFYSSAYAQFIAMAKHLGGAINYDPCGAIHLMNTPAKEKQFHSLMKNWHWHGDHLQFLDTKETNEKAGIDLDCPSLFLPDAGSVSPRKICQYYVQDIDIQYNKRVTDLDILKEDYIVICNAHGAVKFEELRHVSLSMVRGQITKIRTNEESKNIKSNIHFNGYISRNHDGHHHIGASFQPWMDDKAIRSEDDQENIIKVKSAVPALSDSDFNVTHSWAGLRTASKDRFPMVAPLHDSNNIFMSLAFSSHGLVGSIKAAHIIADFIRQKTLSIQIETKKYLHYQRFNGKVG